MRALLFLYAIFICAGAEASTMQIKGTVVKVYDGDTVVMDDGERVRVRWVNSPERKPAQEYAEEARRFAERLVLNRKVVLHLDPENKRDGYGRLIAAVQVGEIDLSLALVERGLAHVFIIPPEPDDISHLLKAQIDARSKRRGIWSTSRYRGSLHITSFHANAPGDDRENLNGEYLRICNISNQPIDLGTFTLRNASGKRWRLPAVEVPTGHTVKVHTGLGVSQASATKQITAHLNSTEPIWSNDGDRATLLNEKGQTVDVVASGNMR